MARIEPIVLSRRDERHRQGHTLQDRVESDRRAGDPWASLRTKPRVTKKLAITVFQLPARQGNVGTAGLPRCLR